MHIQLIVNIIIGHKWGKILQKCSSKTQAINTLNPKLIYTRGPRQVVSSKDHSRGHQAKAEIRQVSWSFNNAVLSTLPNKVEKEVRTKHFL